MYSILVEPGLKPQMSLQLNAPSTHPTNNIFFTCTYTKNKIVYKKPNQTCQKRRNFSRAVKAAELLGYRADLYTCTCKGECPDSLPIIPNTVFTQGSHRGLIPGNRRPRLNIRRTAIHAAHIGAPPEGVTGNWCIAGPTKRCRLSWLTNSALV
jgi:hypothetical protein